MWAGLADVGWRRAGSAIETVPAACPVVGLLDDRSKAVICRGPEIGRIEIIGGNCWDRSALAAE